MEITEEENEVVGTIVARETGRNAKINDGNNGEG
jgi:hypothetical protein